MEDVLAVRDEYRMQTLAGLTRECNSNRLSKRAFCRERGISEKSFYYWLQKLRNQAVQSALPQLVQLESGLVAEDMLRIHYRGAKLNLPPGGGYGCCGRAALVGSVVMIDLSRVRNYYIVCGYTDLRYGITALTQW